MGRNDQHTPASYTHPDESTAVRNSPEPVEDAPRKRKFGLSEIANMFIKLRRHRRRATISQRSIDQITEEGSSTLNPGSESTTLTPVYTPAPSATVQELERVDTETTQPDPSNSYQAQAQRTPSPKGRVRLGFHPYSKPGNHHIKASKPHHLVSCSGDTPKTHAGMAESVFQGVQAMPVEYTDRYDCVGGVNVGTLLRATRNTLLETVETIGANALVDEM